MATKRWGELSPLTRRIIVVTGAIDGVLRMAALRDLAGRSDGEINGSRKRWKAGLLLVNSGGVLPVAYFAKGRRR